jgi:hypothetical protein
MDASVSVKTADTAEMDYEELPAHPAQRRSLWWESARSLISTYRSPTWRRMETESE